MPAGSNTRASTTGEPTADRILDAAERLVQTRGFNGFSYADIASELDIKKPSIHHHFATKALLGQRLLARYSDRFFDALHRIDRQRRDPRGKLASYAELYGRVLRNGSRMCLCGVLAAELPTLSRPLRDSVKAFFDENEAWVGALLSAGRAARAFRFDGEPRVQARLVVSSLEGAMLVARAYGDPARFDAVARRVVGSLDPPAREVRRIRPSRGRAPKPRARRR
ncbi:MAG: TetR/AcrR family transcriptional regulator [Acidobacteriota bacterium]